MEKIFLDKTLWIEFNKHPISKDCYNIDIYHNCEKIFSSVVNTDIKKDKDKLYKYISEHIFICPSKDLLELEPSKVLNYHAFDEVTEVEREPFTQKVINVTSNFIHYHIIIGKYEDKIFACVNKYDCDKMTVYNIDITYYCKRQKYITSLDILRELKDKNKQTEYNLHTLTKISNKDEEDN